MKLDELYNEVKSAKSDINEHIEVLKKYTDNCDHVTEMGVRAILSTWAFMKGSPKTLICYDLETPEYYGGDLKLAKEIAKENNIDFKFIKGDVLSVQIDPTDLLFIDTFHAYDQLKAELGLHADNVNKYIIMHDTVSFGTHDEPLTSLNSINTHTEGCGLLPAIEQFLSQNEDWKKAAVFTNNNGLTVLERVKTKQSKEIIVDKKTLKDNPELEKVVDLGDKIEVPEFKDVKKEDKKDDKGVSKTVPTSRTEK